MDEKVCKYGHSHPQQKAVRAATNNPTEPWGPRPYHCPDCSEVTKSGTRPDNWERYTTIEDAGLAGHFDSCKICFD
jgi:hypothetical protein